MEALESQTVVGLPGEEVRGGERVEKRPADGAEREKGSKTPIFGGIVVAAVAAAFLAGPRPVGRQQPGHPGSRKVWGRGRNPAGRESGNSRQLTWLLR